MIGKNPVINTPAFGSPANKFNKEMFLSIAKYQKQGTMGGYALIKRSMHNGELLSLLLNEA